MSVRIRLEDVWMVYPGRGAVGKTAVAGVSLDVGPGERVGIVGRNGAGKSTLLHVIAGLSGATRGTVEVAGKVTSVMTLGVGLREALSGRENIYVDGELQGRTRAEVDRVIGEVIAFAELGEFIDRPVRTYSTGMKARLGFSMITHLDPEILVIDEALSVGDAAFSAKAAARVREICARGLIVIVVSHSMTAIEDICSRCLWMDAGRVVMDGLPGAVTAAYVEAVHDADDALQLEAHRRLAGARSERPFWEVQAIGAVDIRTGEERTRLQGGRDVRLEVRAQVPRDADAALRVRLVRLDGLVVFDERFRADVYRTQGTAIALAVEMTPLVLGAGLYRVEASLLDRQACVAERSAVVEVFTLRAPRGGQPVLRYPFTVEVVPVRAEGSR